MSSNRYSVGSKRPRGWPVLKTNQVGRQVAIQVYTNPHFAQMVADSLNAATPYEAAPVSKAPRIT